MAVENEKVVEKVKEKPNGHMNGHANGHVNGHAIGHVAKPKPRSKPRKSWTVWLLNHIARLSTWYAIITIIFRCPSSPKYLSDTTPAICKPYLSGKTYIQPHLQPYYDAYAAPYVGKAKPYVDQANYYVIHPVSRNVASNYEKFAAPQLQKVKTSMVAEWDRLMLPQVLLAQERATELYASNLAPHVDKASSIATPYYEAAKDNAANVHQQHILPALESSKPHLHSAYVATETFVVSTAVPLAHQAWLRLVIFFDGTLWPFVKGVYSDNVRPQLVMINERIATYQQGRKLRSIIDEVETTTSPAATAYSETISASVTSSSMSSLAATAASIMSSISEEFSASVMPKAERETQVATDGSVTEDLVKWQKKFAIAADKGADDLKERLKDITEGLIASDIDGEGRGLAYALEKSAEVKIVDVKADIQAVIGKLPDEATPSVEQKAEEEIVRSIREAGLEIKDRATKLRDWAHNFQSGITQRTALAADSTLQVLDNIRDLGLQEIGMRWAWMDGITYKHWAKYHDLKQRFDEWRDEVRAVAVDYPAAIEAKELAQIILEEGMAVTEDAAKELLRLRDVAKWKIRARDATDNFETRIIPAAAVSAAAKVAEEFREVTSSLAGSTQGTMESLASRATESAGSLSSAASSAVVDRFDAAQPILDSLLESVSDVASSVSASVVDTSIPAVQSAVSEATSSVSSAVIGTSTGSAESLASEASSSISSVVAGTQSGSAASVLSDAASSVSSAVAAADIPSFEKASSLASSVALEASDSASSVIELPPVSSASKAAKDVYESATSSATSIAASASSRVFAGAMAQEVKGQVPILDDVFDDDTKESLSESIKSFADGAEDQYAQITKAISEAIYGTQPGTVESLTSAANEQYQSALAAASKVLYGTPKPTAEILASAVQSRYQQAVAAASSVISSMRQTSTAESILQQASAAYSAAISQAQDYRSAAAEVVSKQIGATPKPIHAQMLESITSAYEGSVAIASGRLEEALSAASKQLASLSSAASGAIPTQNRMESISSVASSRLQDALNAASSQYNNAKIAVGAEPTPATMQAQQAYYAAIGYAYEQYGNFVSAGSSAVYGTPTPVYQSLIAQASSQYALVSAAAGSSLNAYLSSLSSVASKATKTKSPAQSLLDEASASYSSALSVASASLSVASSSASVAVFGTPAPAYQSALDAVTSQYFAATALALSNMNELLSSASSAVGKKKTPAQGVLDSISSQYNAAVVAASSSLAAASASASSALYGPPEGSFDSMASVASTNWEALMAAASSNIYGKPTPAWASVTSQAVEFTAQATDVAVEKYAIISAYVSEIIIGREPDFTESVFNKLSSVYYTGMLASASSLASEAYASGSSIASSVSSVASTYFTPPPEINSILDQVNAQLNAAVEAASAQVYGSSKGPVEKATSAAADAYSAAVSAASEAIYGAPIGYGEAASSSFADAAQSASNALSIALFGTPTGQVESATSVVADTYSSISSAVSDSLSSAADQAVSMAGNVQARVSEAIYGPEQSALESAQARVLAAVESARSRLAEFGASASVNVESVVSVVSDTMESAASQVSESVSSVTSRVKDEL